MEEFVDIKGYEGRYQVSRTGKVWSKMSNKEMKQIIHKKYLCVGLYDSNFSQKWKKVHRLVAIAFIPNPENKPQVNHDDGDKLNNNDWNLSWSTPLENIKHSWEHGLAKPQKGEIHGAARLKDYQILEIRASKLSYKELASQYDVPTDTIQRAVSGVSWKHLPMGNYQRKVRKPLTDQLKSEILQLKAQGMLQVHIAGALDIGEGQITYYLNSLK